MAITKLEMKKLLQNNRKAYIILHNYRIYEYFFDFSNDFISVKGYNTRYIGEWF